MLASNSSTIILLAKISLLSKFSDKAKKIVITSIVYEEILKKDSFENSIIKKEVEKGRINRKDIETKYYSDTIKQFKLDEGEASAFALCKSNNYAGILTDDKELMKLCRIENIKFTSAMAIVVMLFRKKIISKEEAIEKIENLQGYGRYSKEIYDYFKGMVR